MTQPRLYPRLPPPSYNESILRIFDAIDKTPEEIENFKTMINQISYLTLSQKNGLFPIFYAIKEDKNEAIEAIIDKHPQLLSQEISLNLTPIYYAIFTQKNIALKTIIDKDPQILDKKNPNDIKPIFFAIDVGNFNALELFIDKYPSIIYQANSFNETPLEKSIEKYFESKNKQQSQEEIDHLKSIVNLIYKKQLGVENDPTEEELKLILDLKNKSNHLNLAYADNDFGMIKSKNIEIYREKLENLQSSNSLNQFVNLGIKVIDSVDKFDNPIRVENENLYIFEANLNRHSAYFIFHVNDQNKLTAISYCDGNRITLDNSLPQDSQYLKGGIRKFNIESPIDFNQEFVEEFLKENSSNVDMQVFYNKLRTQGLKIPDLTQPEQAKFLTKSDFIISTKAQSRGNCSYKSLKILWRYIAELQNPELDFSSRHIDMTERRLDLKTQSSDLQDATLMFKEFKGDLTIQSIEDLIKMRSDLKNDSENISDNARKFITEKIDEILKKTREKSLKKIQANAGDEKQLAIHQKICDLTKPSSTISSSSTSISNSVEATLS